MALTYGFYSSLNGDRKYNAEQMSTLFNGIITDGVFSNVNSKIVDGEETGAMHVTAFDTPQMSVKVSPGRAWFNGTWTRNDAAYTLNFEQASATLPRYDAVVLRVDKTPGGRSNSLAIVKGVASSSPVAPSLVTSDPTHIFQHALAYVRINANQTQITKSLIINAIGLETVPVNGVSAPGSPYIKCILEKYQLDDMISQWRAQFYEWMTQNDQAYEEWTENNQDVFDTWMSSWTGVKTSDFNDWFETLQTALEPDVATSLANQIALLKGVHHATFYENAWTKNGNIYTQTADCLGMEEGYSPILVKDLANGATVTEAKNYNRLYGIISSGTGVTGHNTVTFNVYSKPDADISVGLKGI